MNKREFMAGGVAAVVAAPALADVGDGVPAHASLQRLLTRTQRLPDLSGHAGADVFEAYVGECFDIAAGAGSGERLVVAAVDRVARCRSTEQFDVRFARAEAAAPAGVDGVRVLLHATGQRVMLHLEPTAGGYAARFNLLA